MTECAQWVWFWAGVLAVVAFSAIVVVGLVAAAEFRSNNEDEDPPRFL